MNWEYQMKPSNRARRIYDIVSSIISFKGSVLDVNCGIAPLYPFIKGDYTGFDNNKELIDKLKKIYSKGNWILSDMKDFNQTADIVMNLGVCSNSKPYEPQEAKHLPRMTKRAKYVILETVAGNKYLSEVEFSLDKSRFFTATFETDMDKNHIRKLVILK